MPENEGGGKMNSKKICKVAGVFFAISLALTCLCIFYKCLYEKVSNEINIKRNEIVLREFPDSKLKLLYEKFIKDSIKKRTSNLSKIGREIETGRQRVQEVISPNSYNALNEDIKYADFFLKKTIDDTVEKYTKDKIEQKHFYKSVYQKIAISAVFFFSISILTFLFCFTLNLKRKVEETNIEQRTGFLLIVSSSVMAGVLFSVYGIVEKRNIYEENSWFIVVFITVFAIGIAMYFNIFSSVIEWVKLGKEKNKS